jgi:hypothetical protein
MKMFCSNCGKEILENVYFCSKCGVRTKSGIQAEIPIPKERKYNWEKELEDTGREIGKAFTVAGKEIEKAFKKAMEKIKEPNKKNVACSQCGEKNLNNGKFCYKCGKNLE